MLERGILHSRRKRMLDRVAENPEPNRRIDTLPILQVRELVNFFRRLFLSLTTCLLRGHSERSEESRTDLWNILRRKCDPSFVGEILLPRLRGQDDGARDVCGLSFSSELRNHAVEACEHALFAHDFEHVIQTWSDAASAHGDARRMNKVAGFAAKFLCQRL